MASDTVPVTRERLAAALSQIKPIVEPVHEVYDVNGRRVCTTPAALTHPRSDADGLFGILAAAWSAELAKPAKPIVLHMGDGEVSALGCIVAALDGMSDVAAQRVLGYLWHRYVGEVTP